MVAIALTADSLARSRFAVSPLMQAAAVLHPLHPGPSDHGRAVRHAVRAALADGRLPLLGALHSDISDYAPDFLTPALTAGSAPDLDAELHQIARTPAQVVARQMTRLVSGPPPHHSPASEPKAARGRGNAAVRPFLDSLGEDGLAQRAACEMEVLWKTAIAPAWPALRPRVAEDIEHRAQVVVRQGLAAALNSLHPAITFAAGTLSMPGSPHVTAAPDGPVVLLPSPLATTWLLSSDPWNERGPYLIYPAARGAVPQLPAEPAAHPLADVVGHTRYALLAGLTSPRTTGELARRHHLSPSTVSYHLAHLHRAGLVTRARSGKQVYYQQAAGAEELLDRPGPARRRARNAAHRSHDAAPAQGVVSA
ncbi:ArsR/SmtB family transcription factor [Streptomyces griseocarneus]|uniref:ArsR/SmtB family transcription factor n=1 Tax=Streptomyces griseocarneus TaxID=51201 RepID=UPI00167CF1B0|nr:helix-turn-helix domain-containing protein [Streptomyces griseocarneus]MBZ6472204.1 winged helix-turn-helix domain-containing protein [Streptomyces griseocarneus]GHG73287.1 transcriptional regulator [Streptomyces griseocarneus]